MSVARSLGELVRLRTQVTHVLLSASADLVCNNLFCEKVTQPCLCRLERALESSDPSRVEVLDLSGNRLEALPPSVARMVGLKVLDLRNNAFKQMPKELTKLKNVQVLMDGNPLETVVK